MYRKISAHYIVIDKNTTLKNGIITINKQGEIADIKSLGNNMQETAGVEFYSGILVPGFVNTHCHLELSHLKDKINRNTGLEGFISEIRNLRTGADSEIIKQTQQADKEMLKNGVVAVGDIANTSHSIDAKLKSTINYHTFVELYASNLDVVNNVFESGINLEKLFIKSGLSASVTAHAPYSVNPKLFNLITSHLGKEKSIISIHNQECESENELYISRKGSLYEMFKSKGIDLQGIPTTGKSSLMSIAANLNHDDNTIFVHNTYTKSEDIEFAADNLNNLYWCFCPNANLYIENKLPDIQAFRNKQQKICIGTDSLASNSQLSILDELKVISKSFPNIELPELISWASINGAKALNMDKVIGSFEIGKRPGINLIESINLNSLKLTGKSRVKKLV